MKKAEGRRQKAEGRRHCFDFLRVFAIFAVMMLHVAAQNFHNVDVNSFEWKTFNFYDGIVRFGVPVFVMISGALFLSKDIPLKKIYSKYIFRIFTAFMFWSFMYALKGYIKDRDIIKALGHFMKGHYHLWFMFMIAGLYMILPFVRKIAESKVLTKYFLALALVFAFIMPEIADIISVFSETYSSFMLKVIDNFRMRFVMGFTGYFLLGYVMNNIEISPKLERLIYMLGIIGFSATVVMSEYASLFRNEPKVFYDNLSVNVLCEASAVFVFFREHFNTESNFIRLMSAYTFGAYLVHAFVISLLSLSGLNSLTFCPLVSVPIIAVIVFILSFIISAVINNIPFLKKYIV